MRRPYPVTLSCEVLQVSASGYFSWLQRRGTTPGGPSGRHSDEALLAHIRSIHAEVKGEYGWPRMHKELLARGIRVGKERVRRLWCSVDGRDQRQTSGFAPARQTTGTSDASRECRVIRRRNTTTGRWSGERSQKPRAASPGLGWRRRNMTASPRRLCASA
jgi:hypothetical protein